MREREKMEDAVKAVNPEYRGNSAERENLNCAEHISYEAVYTPSSVMPLRIDAEICIGCNRCVEACQIDVLLPGERTGEPPRVFWPGECWYCGACVMECPKPGAITLRHPLMNQAAFVPRKSVE